MKLSILDAVVAYDARLHTACRKQFATPTDRSEEMRDLLFFLVASVLRQLLQLLLLLSLLLSLARRHRRVWFVGDFFEGMEISQEVGRVERDGKDGELTHTKGDRNVGAMLTSGSAGSSWMAGESSLSKGRV